MSRNTKVAHKNFVGVFKAKNMPNSAKPSTHKPHAMPGNKNGVKLKDPDVRQEAFRQYCSHLASGYPKESFFFNHPIHSVTWETMDRYIAEHPSEFPPFLIKQAKAARYKHWLDKGIGLMEGKFKGGSPVVWQTIMRNIFRSEGWDRETIAENNRSHVERLAESIRSEAVHEAEAGDSVGK
jgi:hypothetical protein